MRRSQLVIPLLCAALVASCTPEMSTRERLVQLERVEAQLETWVRLRNNARTDSLAALYWAGPELLVVRPSGDVTSGHEDQRQAIRAFYGGIQYMNFVLQNPRTELLAPNVAVSAFGHSTDIIAGGGRGVTAGRGTIVWVRDPEGEAWKIYLEHISVDAASAN